MKYRTYKIYWVNCKNHLMRNFPEILNCIDNIFQKDEISGIFEKQSQSII